ncbi:AraC family transcriptional regulator [Paenibacillus sp. IB182496]|uniref:AraC family transcriptional regulator n=2 Tax=Paenibacillus sabuli TaxID=2772509 RepID=A0A927BVA0_9BACL|nr:AraC family transcriptional regulator [Paenibacillus sabuli]
MKSHYSFTIALNATPGRGELTVLFSGKGKPYPLHKMGPAVYDYYLIHTVSTGRGVIECRGKRYTCSAGDSFVIVPGELFSYEADAHEPWTYQWVAFRGHAAGTLLSGLGVSGEAPVLHAAEPRRILGLYRSLRQSLQSSQAGALTDLEAGGWLRLLLSALAADQAPQTPLEAPTADIDRQIDQAILWLSLQYEQSISIARIARTLGYHRTHLSKMFKQATGLSPMQYLFKIRMERAETLLRQKLTVAQVAASVGYADALYFSKQFRKWKGLSPSAFREQA